MSARVFLLALALMTHPDTASAQTAQPIPPRKALVYAHRGASALRPEHTLAAYAQAIADGADFIEPDLVSTRDGVLVARHENEIGGTTDVARHPEFAARRTRKIIDGESIEGWFSEDFSLAELKTLRARERLPQLRGTRWDGQFAVLTLDEIIAFTAAEATRRGRPIGLVPELKHPSYFRGLGLPMEETLLSALQAHPYTQRARVVIQSFEAGTLRTLRQRLGRDSHIRLLQLLGPAQQLLPGETHGRRYADLTTPAGLREIASYADAIGPDLRSLIPLDADGRLARPTSLLRDAHAAGLEVQPYTFRPENRFLAPQFRDGAAEARNEAGSIAEIRAYLRLGIDAFFTDDPALGRRAVDLPPP
ncbi:MAG TPA: glycerophosphodiester phosphodiesterase [Stenotrophomonas sp.]|nr:glycerophosphodiester phosphodiesterase [Stenotrophomonas sp.]